MGIHRVELSDAEERRCEAYLRWHALQPTGGFERIVPIDGLTTVDELLHTALVPWRAMLAHWWDHHADAHRQEPTADA